MNISGVHIIKIERKDIPYVRLHSIVIKLRHGVLSKLKTGLYSS